MKSIGIVLFLLILMPLGGIASTQTLRPHQPAVFLPIHTRSYHADGFRLFRSIEAVLPNSSGLAVDTGIKEIVPKSFRTRYDKWKSELLATKIGRELWDQYAKDQRFTLKIVVTNEKKSGAGTDEYKWNDQGELVGATIFLGKDLDRGFPDPVYYPVMNSLGIANGAPNISGNLLASTKMAHELGHVRFTSEANGKVFQRQNKLIANYYNIFLKNGHDTSDPRLVTMVEELGARPIEIWEDREYWSEVVALRYLVERMDRDSSFCNVLRKITSNLNNYAAGYKERFEQLYGAHAQRYCGG